MKTRLTRLAALLWIVTLPVRGEDIASQVEGLGDPSFRVRSAATRWLVAAAALETNEIAVLEACVIRYASTDDVEVLARLDEIMAPVVNRRYYDRPMGFLGARLEAATVTRGGKEVPAVRIGSVVEGFPAEKGGFKEGDLILSMNSRPVPPEGVEPFIAAIQRTRPGTRMTFQVLRGEEAIRITVEIARRPNEDQIFMLNADRPPFDMFYEEWKAEAIQAHRDGKKPILPE